MFHVTTCSCCDTLAVCYHAKQDHGLDYCWKCIESWTLWHVLPEEARLDLRQDYDRAVARKDFQRELVGA